MNVLIESAVKLDSDQKSAVEKVVAKKVTNGTFEYKVNPNVLGGLRVTMGSKRIDLSLKSRLQTIQNAL